MVKAPEQLELLKTVTASSLNAAAASAKPLAAVAAVAATAAPASQSVTLKTLFAYTANRQHFELQLITRQHKLKQILNYHAINRPGMNLFGFFKFFAHDRIQVFGKGEYEYLHELCAANKLSDIKKFLSYPIPLIVFSHNNQPPPNFLALAEEQHVAVACSPLPTLALIHHIHNFFDDCVLVKEVQNGAMMEIYGSGVFIQGPPGIGKSECVLELLERGQRFVADDVVNIKRLKDNTLIASPSPLLATHMGFKGIGIINVAHLFGVRSILKEKEIDLVIFLENFTVAKDAVISSLHEQTNDILSVPVPMITIPVKTISNVSILIETATMNHRLKKTGYDTTKEFNKRIMKFSKKQSETEN